MSPGEMSGFLDVKVPARVRRRRGLAPWKAWKRQWITITRAPDAGLEVQLGSTCVRVPPRAILCRTDSRSRKFAFGVFSWTEPRWPSLYLAGSSESDTQLWMQHIRNMLNPPNLCMADEGFLVSLIDNAHSRIAGLTGMYGKLMIGPRHLTLHDPNTGQVIYFWKWQHLHQFHLAATEVREDNNKICVIHTSSDFCAGAGQIHLFSTEAPQLLNSLIANSRVQHLLSSPLPSPPPLKPSARRLSRSESDLHCFSSNDLGSPRQRHHFLRKKAMLERSHSSSRTSATSDDYVQTIGGKVASSLLSAGLGLLFSTPAGSEVDTESLHEYQQVGSLDSDDDEDDSLPCRRESGVSIASGIYEEIMDTDQESNSTNHYENPAMLHWRDSIEDKEDSPPPLPPRKQRQHYLDSVLEDSGREWCYRTPPISTPRPSQEIIRGISSSCSPDFARWIPPHRIASPQPDPEPDYLPMSPGPTHIMPEEQHYTVMASVNTM
ncbi:hypothetical protein L9F63_006135 [Diploptera punctata]|uniref:PH domain-containing protein n=1 Tax=Diploptera punctata TaxID=6984 RepID=A0AAD7ZB74_DIPPU|nr:hypothetical protein L9F63_006135 [Diploptera punctata]